MTYSVFIVRREKINWSYFFLYAAPTLKIKYDQGIISYLTIQKEMSSPPPATPTQAQPEPEDTGPALPFYPPHRTQVDRALFQHMQWRQGGGRDPQSMCRLTLPCIYVLACENSYVYVGLTDSSNLSSRLSAHWQAAAARCTRTNRPRYLHQLLYGGSRQLENEVVRWYCEHTPPEWKIRGGDWCGQQEPPFRRMP